MNNGELPSPTPDSMSLKDQKKFGDVLNSAVQGAATSAEVNNGQQKKGGWVQKTWGRLKSRGQKDNGALQPAVGAAPENRTTSIKDGSVSPSKTTPAPTEASAASVSADELTKSQAQHGYESDQLMAAATGEAVSIADPYLAAAKQVEAATNRPVAQPTAETPSSVLTEQENPSIGELPTNRNFNVAEASQILGLNEHDTRIALRVLGAVEEDQNSGTYRVDQKNVEKFRVAFKGAVIDLRRSASAAPAPSAEPIVSAPEQAAAPAMVTTDHETPEPSSSSKTAATLMNLLSGSVVTDSSTLPGIHEPGELPPFLRGRSTPEPAASDESTTKKEGSIIAGFPTDRDFTAEDISRNLGLDEFTAKSFLEGLKIDGIVEEDKDSPGNYKVNQEKFRDAQGMLEATADSFTKAASPTGADTGPTAPIPGPDTAASAAPAEATAPAPDRGTASDPEPTATTTPAIETPLTPAEVEEINKWVSMLLSSNKDAQRTISFVLSLNPTVTSEQLQKRLKLNNNLADQARLDALISELQSRGMIQESTTEPGKFNVVKTTFESTVAPDSSAAGATTVVPENPPPSPIDSLPAEQKTKIQQLLTGKTIGVQELLKALDNDQDKVREIQSYLTGSGEYRYDARKQRFVKVTEALGTRIKNKLEAAGQNLTSRDFYIEAAKTYIDSLSWRGKSKVAYLTGLGVGVGAPILIASAGLTGGGTLVVGLGFAAAKLAITQIPAYALTRRTRKNIRKFAEDTFKPGESLSAGLDEAEQKKRVGQFVRQVYELTKRDHLLEKEKGKITERLHPDLVKAFQLLATGDSDMERTTRATALAQTKATELNSLREKYQKTHKVIRGLASGFAVGGLLSTGTDLVSGGIERFTATAIPTESPLDPTGSAARGVVGGLSEPPIDLTGSAANTPPEVYGAARRAVEAWAANPDSSIDPETLRRAAEVGKEVNVQAIDGTANRGIEQAYKILEQSGITTNNQEIVQQVQESILHKAEALANQVAEKTPPDQFATAYREALMNELPNLETVARQEIIEKLAGEQLTKTAERTVSRGFGDSFTILDYFKEKGINDIDLKGPEGAKVYGTLAQGLDLTSGEHINYISPADWASRLETAYKVGDNFALKTFFELGGLEGMNLSNAELMSFLQQLYNGEPAAIEQLNQLLVKRGIFESEKINALVQDAMSKSPTSQLSLRKLHSLFQWRQPGVLNLPANPKLVLGYKYGL